MKRFTLIKKAPPVNYALESTRPQAGGCPRIVDVGDGVHDVPCPVIPSQ